MTLPLALHLLGSLMVIGFSQIYGVDDPLTFIGWAVLLYGLGLSMVPVKGSVRRYTFISLLGGVLSLGLMVAGGIGVLDVLDLEPESLKQAEVVLAAAWPLIWLCATLSLIAVERLRAANPIVLLRARARTAAFAGLSTALALSCLVPLNYLAHENNERWDHSYFKTASPGESTQAIIENLSSPVQVYLFFPYTSDVTEEIRTYFDQLHSPWLEVSYVDQALEAGLAKELKVQKNGTIAFVRGQGEEAQVERVRIGTQMEKARRKLKSLDQEVHKSLLKIVVDSRTAYVTMGHGEMYWKKGTGVGLFRLTSKLKSTLKGLHFKLKELGPAQGLAHEVPEDADLVAVLGPTQPFLPEEVAALQAYIAQGGALLIALDPKTETDLSVLLGELGLAYDDSKLLVGSRQIFLTDRKVTDRYNLVTNKASTHPSVTTLNRKSRTQGLWLGMKQAAPLTILEDPEHKVEVTLRSMPEVFLDLDSGLRFDAETEQKKGWPLAVAVTGQADEDEAGEPREFRVIVTGDANWASDPLMMKVNGNDPFLRDGVAWLVNAPDVGGTVNDEEDVKIQHTKEGDGWMFYGTTFLVPFGLLGLGLIRLRIRRKRGNA